MYKGMHGDEKLGSAGSKIGMLFWFAIYNAWASDRQNPMETDETWLTNEDKTSPILTLHCRGKYHSNKSFTSREAIEMSFQLMVNHLAKALHDAVRTYGEFLRANSLN